MVQPVRALTLPSLRDLGLLDVRPADETAASPSSKSAPAPPAHDPGPPSRDPLKYPSPLLEAIRASHHPNVAVPAPRNGSLPSNSLPSPYSRIQAYVGPGAPREHASVNNRMHPYRRLASLPSDTGTVPPDSSAKRRCLSLPEGRRPSLSAENVRREMYFPTSGQRSTIGEAAGLAASVGEGRRVERGAHVVEQPPSWIQAHSTTSRPRQQTSVAVAAVDDALLVPWQPLATPSNSAPAATHIRLPLNLLRSTLLSLRTRTEAEGQARARLSRNCLGRSRGGWS